MQRVLLRLNVKTDT
uniref:Uncharacterized protein n=1 Tax=Rhizophora mucronata TaxID=61149 RepID=A0A2P2QGJ8_RHIMU